MRVEIEDLPTQSNNLARKNGSTAIRLIPETNGEMAALERCLTVEVKFEPFRRLAHSNQVSYVFFGYYGLGEKKDAG